MKNLKLTVLSVAAVIVAGGLLSSANGDEFVTAQIPVVVNVDAEVSITPTGDVAGMGTDGTVTGGTERVFEILITVPADTGNTNSVLHGSQRRVGAAFVAQRRGSVTVNLAAEQYRDAQVSLYNINGRRISRDRVSASSSNATHDLSRQNLAAGVYFLRVTGADGNRFSSRITHGGGRLNFNVAYADHINHHANHTTRDAALSRMTNANHPHGTWILTVEAAGYITVTQPIFPVPGLNEVQTVTLSVVPSAFENFTESLTSAVGLDMIAVAGGTFQMGCSGASNPECGQNETPVRAVTVSNYYIGKFEVTNAQWRAVMGDTTANNNNPKTTVDWYHAMEFVCELNRLTGKKYRLATEAEWEFAARGGTAGNQAHRFSGSSNADAVAWHSGNAPTQWGMTRASAVGQKDPNALGIHDMSGNVREWVYDAWNTSYPSADQTDPTGAPIIHIQKIRRGGSFMVPAFESTVTARRIRSIEGADGDLGFRVAVSADQGSMPAGVVDACEIARPPLSHGAGTTRDMRLVTGNDHAWVQIMEFNNQTFYSVLRVWDDGVAAFRSFMDFSGAFTGQWATSNDFSLHIVNSSGTARRFIYYVVSPRLEITLMAADDMPNRWEFRNVADLPSGANVPARPTNVGTTRTPESIIQLGGGTIVDMTNPPTTGRDSRLIVAQSLGSGQAWLQDNVQLGAGGSHRYRFDFTPDTARFVVWDVSMNTSVTISSGRWFTIDNTFLRIIGSNGRRYDYLYTVAPATTGQNAREETHYHISFQGYERGDFRMFTRAAVPGGIPDWREPTMAPYATHPEGGSTYCPPGTADSAGRCPNQ